MCSIQDKVLEHSTIYSDGWMAYDSLTVDGYDHHRIYFIMSLFEAKTILIEFNHAGLLPNAEAQI